ncbi:hypothetical protein [Francisella sp. SYW-9]|uniref:hypothetical protein n=1 Tax=Francisella sp. SYW-9 TaxID=2610888 RepID=UPI00123D39D0|nr:hypothetical protein [Francisella sp. SYW-9]
MNWVKQGKIFSVDDNFGWMKTHAQIPSVLVLKDRLRVYFSTRYIPTESKTTFLDLDIKNPKKILYIHDKPILENGKAGTFDEHGVMPSGVIRKDNKIYLYYSGWSKRASVPYTNLTGIAVSYDDGVTFERIGDGPILSTNIYEPYSATCPYVFFDNGLFNMFYCSGTGWVRKSSRYEHTYDIKYASSRDGVHFLQDGKSLITPKNDGEAITRPTILKKNDLYHMWFCYRGSDDFRDGLDAYRIGYAWSKDLEVWNRDDKKVGIDVSYDGWDSKMIAYPYIVETSYGIYMFYNGNGFGQSGFGYAILETS